MSADTLRRAAALMREQYVLSTSHDSRACKSPTCQRRVFHHAVADWLMEVYCAETGEVIDGFAAAGPVGVSEGRHALAVARAYLGGAE